MKKVLLLLLLLCTFSIQAQTLDNKTKSSIAKYFKEYTLDNQKIGRCDLSRNKNNIIVNKKNRTITIYANDNFGHQLFTPQLTESIYDNIKKLLPKSYKKYNIVIFTNEKPIEELIPNIYREKDRDKKRLWNNTEYTGDPWVNRTSRPFNISKGLQNRHLAVWQSHGRFFKNEENRWKWQRPSLYCTTEDLFTQSIVVPFLIPMLENAGAIVYTPRERDWQKNSVIVDNDNPNAQGSLYQEVSKHSRQWKAFNGKGFALNKETYIDEENPFTCGTARYIETETENDNISATAKWIPNIPEEGEYAVYVSYQSAPNSSTKAKYSVVHKGGISYFEVNQKIGGGTWVYLGTFFFEKGASEAQMVVLNNNSEDEGIICADAVRFGGGMGVVARGDSLLLSGMPRYLEGARYAALYNGFPYEIYSPQKGKNDYADDINCRSHIVNYLAGGSIFNPDSVGKGVPIELSFGYHSDAGINEEDKYIGSLAIVTTNYNDKKLPTGLSRYTSRDLAHIVQSNVQRDMTAQTGQLWDIRGVWDKNYSESRLPVVPSMIFESLSHQNFADMKLGHDPNVKFTFARAVYKAMLQYISFQHNTDYVVQPLPIKNFRIEINNKKENSISLNWEPTIDPLEPTAEANEYILYIRINDGGFDEGTRVKGTGCNVNIVSNTIYSFKVTAVNDGGESFPSEVLSAYRSEQSEQTVMIVNNFHRLSAPASFQNDKEAGFLMDIDAGVSYIHTPEYCGSQTIFDRSLSEREDGLGFSGNEWDDMLTAGNTFDYPYIHGKAISDCGFSFVSCSSEALQAGLIDLKKYPVVDLIIGLEKQGSGCKPFNYAYPYKTFSPAIQQHITDYCNNGGSLFVSGSYIASDMLTSESDRNFIKSVLFYDYAGSCSNHLEKTISNNSISFQIPRTVNENSYSVSCPDIILPLSPAFPAFVFEGSKQCAGIAYKGQYSVLATSFPFESIQSETQRTQLMGAILRFLNNNH